jgi:mannose-6-phosphate isomerase-like protein (cupin superfamily)
MKYNLLLYTKTFYGGKRMMIEATTKGKVIKVADFIWEDRNGCNMSKPIISGIDSLNITGIVVHIPSGEKWESCEIGYSNEIIAVNHKGNGTAIVNGENSDFTKHSALYSPTGTHYSIAADKGEEIHLYIWQSKLSEVSKTSNNPVLFNDLYNNETVFEGFKGTDPTQINKNPANMNFLFWPGTGCAHLSLHCGIQEPGQNFGVHSHPDSEELFIGVDGIGQVHLDGEWIDFEAGDILYSPKKIYHGTRNPHTGQEAKQFVTCGGPIPFDVNFYLMANLSPEVK